MDLEWEPGNRPWREVRGPTMRPPSRARTRIALALVAVGVGFLVGVQARESGERSSRLAAESPEDLTQILADLNAEADRLSRQISAVRVKEALYRSSATGEELLLRDARKALADLQVLSGTVAVRGPGVTIVLADREERITWETLLDTVQELRDAGAEAIAVGDARVVASSWFGPASRGAQIDGRVVRPPYVIRAVGSPDGIAEALAIPGGPVTLLSAEPGVRVQVTEEAEILLPPLRRQISFRYARPT